MGFKCGIVGLPNVGKSTLFNALTSGHIEAANYPFCTIEPNVGTVAVPDKRLVELSDLVSPQATIPARIEFVDIAGLVQGASEGEGLGNQFLGHIRETHAIAHVVRCFTDDNIVHVADRVNPVADADTISLELMLADLQSAEQALHKLAPQIRSGQKDAKPKAAILERIQAALAAETPLRSLDFTEDDTARIREYAFLTQKPLLYIANVSDAPENDQAHLAALEAKAANEGARVIVLSAKMEAELLALDAAAERAEFLESLGFAESGLARFILEGYDLLGLATYFTAGEKEVRAWTIEKGDNAQTAAGKIHTDFARGFIRAEVTGYDDFITNGGAQGAKAAGKMRLEGKTYEVADGDIMHFLFSV